MFKLLNWGPIAGVVTHLRVKCAKCNKSYNTAKLENGFMDLLPILYSKNYIKQFGDPRISSKQKTLF